MIPAALRETVAAWHGEAGRVWLDALPGLAARLLERWELTAGPALPGGTASLVLAVAGRDGRPAVLKIPLRDAENRTEPDALRHYGGDGAVELYDTDAESGAMLLERLRPGTALSTLVDRAEALHLAGGVLRRLRRPPPAGHRFPLVRDLLAGWAELIPAGQRRHGRPLPAELVDRAAGLARELAATLDGEVLVNRDAHLGNILAAQREPWLLIDPKPLVGDPAFDGGYLLLDLLGAAPTRESANRWVGRVAGELAVSPDRVRGHALVRAVENVFWALDTGSPATDCVAQATALSPQRP